MIKLMILYDPYCNQVGLEVVGAKRLVVRPQSNTFPKVGRAFIAEKVRKTFYEFSQPSTGAV